jgi:RNA polymerase sigma-70 factor (ECF subfamily)
MDSNRAPENNKKKALDAVIPVMYDELRQLAASYMRHERASHTLDPTALVNETYLRLLGQHSVDFANRAQVLGVAAQMMRRILMTHEEKRKADKRGGDFTIIRLSDTQELEVASDSHSFSEVDQVLSRLEKLDARQAKVAELKIFGGMTNEEIAEFLEISTATVKRDWLSGRLWLIRELRIVRTS